eukprot:s4361_g7.t1
MNVHLELVRPADWSYDENLSKCEQPTYGCFSMGQCVTSRTDDIPNGTLVDLLDRATTKGKGQQEILLALQYKGAKEHLALKAGGNDWAQLQCALKGVVTTSEKYTVARSEHCTIRSLIVVWQDLSFIEGCDPLALPLAALLYQQADNFWLRKLAHGRELYLIPTGDIATVVFGTELLSQLRNRGIDMDRISQCKARQDGQTLDKINNTKYAAKVVAEYIQQWAPMKATDPSSQRTITQLQQQVAELKQRLGDVPDSTPPESSAPPPSSAMQPPPFSSDESIASESEEEDQPTAKRLNRTNVGARDSLRRDDVGWMVHKRSGLLHHCSSEQSGNGLERKMTACGRTVNQNYVPMDETTDGNVLCAICQRRSG